MTTSELKSFPPINDTIDFVKQVDWQDVRRRVRAGFNNCGLVIAVVGEKIHDAGAWMAQVWTQEPLTSGFSF